MTQQAAVDFDSAHIKILEDVFTFEIAKRIKKFVWADKLFSSDGSRRFTIVFAPSNSFEFRVEVTTQVRIVICGLNVFRGGQGMLADIETFNRTISVLQRASKHLQSSALVLRRQTFTPEKRMFSDYELSDKLFAIDEEDAEVVSTEITIKYIVKDKVNGNVVELTGFNEPAGAILFNARVKLHAMRREDD